MTTTVEVEAKTDLYPSRNDDTAKLLPRRDPVAYGADKDGPLNSAHLRRYDSLGYLFFERFFPSEELEPYSEELDRLRASDETKKRAEVIIEPESQEVRSVFAIHDSNPVLAKLATHPRLVAIAQQLLGSPVYIHQSRVNYKPGYRGKEFYWHSDFETWHVEDGMPRMRAVSCSISLTDNHPANGPLLVIPSSHQKFLSCAGRTPENHYEKSLRKQEYGVPDDDNLLEMANEGGIEPLAGPAGSVVFFECNIMHGSSSNITPWPRSNLFVVFNSIENQLVDPFCGLPPRPPFLATREVEGPIEIDE